MDSSDVWTPESERWYWGEGWWRHERELEDWERELVGACLRAHSLSVVRGGTNANGTDGAQWPCSSAAVVNGWHGSRDYAKAIASGLLTLGAVHGPIEAAYELITQGGERDWQVRRMIDAGQKVPGWGNAFVKGGPDPVWAEVEGLLPEWKRESLGRITHILHACGKRVWPNAAGYTAAVAHLVRMPGRVAGWMFVAGRLAGWSELIWRKG